MHKYLFFSRSSPPQFPYRIYFDYLTRSSLFSCIAIHRRTKSRIFLLEIRKRFTRSHTRTHTCPLHTHMTCAFIHNKEQLNSNKKCVISFCLCMCSDCAFFVSSSSFFWKFFLCVSPFFFEQTNERFVYSLSL